MLLLISALMRPDRKYQSRTQIGLFRSSIAA